LRCHPEALLGSLSALRETLLDLAPRRLGSPSLTQACATDGSVRIGAIGSRLESVRLVYERYSRGDLRVRAVCFRAFRGPERFRRSIACM
jgi:hypothetical protein